MRKLSNNELERIEGGFSFLSAAGIIGVGIFIIGVLDGFTRPLACRK